MPKQTPTRRWRSDVPDSVLLACSRQYDHIPSARSLSPDAQLIDEYIRERENGHLDGPAHATVAAWHAPWADRIRVQVTA